MAKISVVVIHGGEVFNSYKDYLNYVVERPVSAENFNPHPNWKTRLQADLGSEFKVFLPRMPCSEDAKFDVWEAWLYRLFPHLGDTVIFVGESLGGIFVAKTLSRPNFPLKVAGTILVAAPFTDENTGRTLATFRLPDPTLKRFREQAGEIQIFHSTDDPVVPFEHANMYHRTLAAPVLSILHNRGHLNVENFPEMTRAIKRIALAYA